MNEWKGERWATREMVNGNLGLEMNHNQKKKNKRKIIRIKDQFSKNQRVKRETENTMIKDTREFSLDTTKYSFNHMTKRRIQSRIQVSIYVICDWFSIGIWLLQIGNDNLGKQMLILSLHITFSRPHSVQFSNKRVLNKQNNSKFCWSNI